MGLAGHPSTQHSLCVSISAEVACAVVRVRLGYEHVSATTCPTDRNADPKTALGFLTRPP